MTGMWLGLSFPHAVSGNPERIKVLMRFTIFLNDFFAIDHELILPDRIGEHKYSVLANNLLLRAPNKVRYNVQKTQRCHYAKIKNRPRY